MIAGEKPHAVIVVGTHHYSPQKSMPDFAGELERLGFETTVINPDWDPEKDERGVPGLEALENADVGIFFMRFLKLENEQLGHITKFVESGKPVVCFRTSFHAFNYPKDHPNAAIENVFRSYRIETKDGKTFEGFNQNEDGRTITLLSMGGAKQDIPIKSIQSAGYIEGKSVMPDLTGGLTAQQVASIVAYLKTVK